MLATGSTRRVPCVGVSAKTFCCPLLVSFLVIASWPVSSSSSLMALTMQGLLLHPLPHLFQPHQPLVSVSYPAFVHQC